MSGAFVQDVAGSGNGARQAAAVSGGKGYVAEGAPGQAGGVDALRGERRIAPALHQPLHVPFGLPVADEVEGEGFHRSVSFADEERKDAGGDERTDRHAFEEGNADDGASTAFCAI